MPFRNSILGGETLVRNAMQSEGFQSGANGWRIERDGDAEFNDVIIRGSLITGPDGSKHIEITDTPANRIKFFSGDASEIEEGYIEVDFTTFGTDNASIHMQPPTVHGSGNTATFDLTNFTDGVTNASLQARTITLDTGPTGNVFTFDKYIETNESVNLGVLVGTWVTLGGGWPHPRYYLDAEGFVHFVGGVTGGLVGQTIMNLPAGYRPPYLVPVEAEGNLARARITLNTGGNVVLNVGSGTSLLWNCVFPVAGGPMP